MTPIEKSTLILNYKIKSTPELVKFLKDKIKIVNHQLEILTMFLNGDTSDEKLEAEKTAKSINNFLEQAELISTALHSKIKNSAISSGYKDLSSVIWKTELDIDNSIKNEKAEYDAFSSSLDLDAAPVTFTGETPDKIVLSESDEIFQNINSQSIV